MPFDDIGDLGDSIHLWTMPLEGPAVRRVHDARLLSADEAARAARFRFAHDRRRFIAGRGALRRILVHYLAAVPEALRFAYGAAGKPALAQPQAGRPIQFNLSHCEHLGLLAVTHDRALGVDIERVRRASDLASLAQHSFAPQEDATTVCGARHRRHGERRGYRWGKTQSEIGYHGGSPGFLLTQNS